MDSATKLILEEIGQMGVMIVDGEESKIKITLVEDFKLF
jgi:2-C-methyl-D-erythritol 4-phosphate cytidylyltransferase